MKNKTLMMGLLAALLGGHARADGPVLPAAPPKAAAPATPGDYVLAVDDKIAVYVLGQEKVSGQATILPDGTFDYPFVGKVHADGKTVAQVTQTLTQRFKRLVKKPIVSVSVLQSRSRMVTVAGAVKTPGEYPYKVGWRVIDAIAASGGPAQVPELTQATLTTERGAKTIPIDLVKLFSGTDSSLNLPVSPGDVILMQARDQAQAMVSVAGQVAKPGPYFVPTGGASALFLLTQAGGPTDSAALTRAQVTHAGQTRTVNLAPAMNGQTGTAEDNPTLVAGDSVLIPENRAKIAVVGEVNAQGVYKIPDGEELTTTSALALAGGATRSGDGKNVSIIRRGADGQDHVIAVNTQDVLKGGAKTVNAALLPGDIVYVPKRRNPLTGAQILGSLSSLLFLRGLGR